MRYFSSSAKYWASEGSLSMGANLISILAATAYPAEVDDTSGLTRYKRSSVLSAIPLISANRTDGTLNDSAIDIRISHGLLAAVHLSSAQVVPVTQIGDKDIYTFNGKPEKMSKADYSKGYLHIRFPFIDDDEDETYENKVDTDRQFHKLDYNNGPMQISYVNCDLPFQNQVYERRDVKIVKADYNDQDATYVNAGSAAFATVAWFVAWPAGLIITAGLAIFNGVSALLGIRWRTRTVHPNTWTWKYRHVANSFDHGAGMLPSDRKPLSNCAIVSFDKTPPTAKLALRNERLAAVDRYRIHHDISPIRIASILTHENIAIEGARDGRGTLRVGGYLLSLGSNPATAQLGVSTTNENGTTYNTWECNIPRSVRSDKLASDLYHLNIMIASTSSIGRGTHGIEIYNPFSNKEA